jgi:hypothetical protein
VPYNNKEESMVKLEEDYWQKIIKEYEGSGLSQNNFCIQQGIPVAQFKYRWCREKYLFNPALLTSIIK